MTFAIPSPYSVAVSASVEAYNPIHDFDSVIKFSSPVLQVDIFKQMIIDLQAGTALQIDLPNLDKLKLLCIKARDPVDVSFTTGTVIVPNSDPIETVTVPVYSGIKSTFFLHLFLDEQPTHLYIKSLVNTTLELSLGGKRISQIA